MQLSPSDVDKLLLSVAGIIARERKERGVRLNYPEAVAYISCWIVERARDGHTVADLMSEGRGILRRADVMEGVPDMLTDIQMEATFPDGRKLVSITDPIS